MTTKNLPASLLRSTKEPVAQPAKQADPRNTDKIVLYLAVPDARIAQLLKQRARVFASRRSPVPLELRIFHAPNLPNTPFDDLALLATLTELGDVEGLDYLTVKPEDLR